MTSSGYRQVAPFPPLRCASDRTASFRADKAFVNAKIETGFRAQAVVECHCRLQADSAHLRAASLIYLNISSCISSCSNPNSHAKKHALQKNFAKEDPQGSSWLDCGIWAMSECAGRSSWGSIKFGTRCLQISISGVAVEGISSTISNCHGDRRGLGKASWLYSATQWGQGRRSAAAFRDRLESKIHILNECLWLSGSAGVFVPGR